MKVQEIVEHLRLLPGVFVDCGFRQGRDAVLKQLNERTRDNQDAFVNSEITGMRNAITELVNRVAPYYMPDDYIFFLEYYGGLLIEGNDCNFSLLGTGPMVEDWYPSIDSDKASRELEKLGFLTLGSLTFNRSHEYKFQRLTFYLDLAGTIQKYSIIEVGPWGQGTSVPFDVLKDRHAYHNKWRKSASSFTELLEQAFATKGCFGYS